MMIQRRRKLERKVGLSDYSLSTDTNVM